MTQSSALGDGDQVVAAVVGQRQRGDRGATGAAVLVDRAGEIGAGVTQVDVVVFGNRKPWNHVAVELGRHWQMATSIRSLRGRIRGRHLCQGATAAASRWQPSYRNIGPGGVNLLVYLATP